MSQQLLIAYGVPASSCNVVSFAQLGFRLNQEIVVAKIETFFETNLLKPVSKLVHFLSGNWNSGNVTQTGITLNSFCKLIGHNGTEPSVPIAVYSSCSNYFSI